MSAYRKLLILYGSETGCSQDVAERIWKEGKGLGFTGPVLPMDDYDVTKLIYERIVVFVCSTTGQGDPPNNMKTFWNFLLRNDLPVTSLVGIKIAVLGLGDSSYVKFNHAAKKLYRRLLGLGAVSLQEIGLADDQHDLGADAVVDPWIANLWKVLDCKPPSEESASLPIHRWNVTFVSETPEDLTFPVDNPKQHYKVKLIESERTTTPEHFQEVKLLKFENQGPEILNYKCGDVAYVRPKNIRSSAMRLFSILSGDGTESTNLRPYAVIQVEEIYKDMPVPKVLSKPLELFSIALNYWDLNAIPRRSVFELLSHFTTNELEKEKLQELSSSAGQEELFSYCNRPRRTILEVLADFPYASVNIPLPYLFEIFTVIRPRAFSIASSPVAHQNNLHLLVATVKYKTKLFIPRVGLCSNYLNTLPVGEIIEVDVKPGSMRFPELASVPVIMVGPGTGVAPFRGYITTQLSYITVAPLNLVLIFGCRNREGDFHFQDEWKRLPSLQLFTAFSRDQPNKIYVQHVIEENYQTLFELIYMHKGVIFLAGNAKNMPDQVKEAFINVIAKGAGFSIEQATAYIESMEKTGRYQNETWS